MFQFLSRNSLHSSPGTHPGNSFAMHRFNSSVGILFIQAADTCGRGTGKRGFQFLSRNSLHSSREKRDLAAESFSVSIPQSEFSSFKLRPKGLNRCVLSSFNSSVGILFIQACGLWRDPGNGQAVSIPQSEFSSFKLAGCARGMKTVSQVSIPQSEFSSFKHGSGNFVRQPYIAVSIPQSEFSSFKLDKHLSEKFPEEGFNSSVGILFIQASCR